MEPPAHPASTTGPYEDIIEALLALDAGALADGVPGILAQHEDRLDRGFVAALRARADAEGERAPATNLLAIALFVENGLDQVERERPTQEQCEFVHRLLTLFLGANTEEHLEAARAAVVAEIRAHPELTGEALPNAVRGVASVLGGTGIPPRPGLLRIVITLGIAALRHWVRWAGHTRLCLAFTQLGWAFARCPDLGVHGSVREAAVASCRAGLELLPPYVLRGHRAEALNTLGMALTGREMGDREENLREAAEHYRAALRVLDKNPHFLTQWACTQTNLAGALHTMARGDQRARQAEAFEALDAGLAVLDRPAWRDAFRDEWARGQMLLGMLLIEHIGGDRPENLARAADALVKAMNVWIEQDRAGELASTANALGLVFAAMGDPGSVARAVESFEMALRHRRRDTHPLEWASTLSNLAATRLRLADQVQHEAAIEQLEQAVRELGDAAELLAQYELSYWLAITRGNQAAAHLALARRQGDDGRDLLESNVFRALSATWYAESVLTRGAFPR
ncbi:MAG TPA: tetratricopeptide repeat protein, partial [Longimicrobium sp.]|nr:tetratricopeptide repeat protein [Longimicrobium sp.]